MRRFTQPVRPALAAAVLAALASVAAAEPAPPLPPEPVNEVKFKPGSGFTLVNGDLFSMQVTGRVQARWTYIDQDKDRGIPNVSDFTAERVRLGVKGMFMKDWKYELEEDFGKSRAELKKAFIEWARYEQFRIEMGQFNVKFDRSQYTSSAKQQFVDRSIAAREFGHEYDDGVDFAGAAFSKKFQWNVGAFNGEKAPTPAPTLQNDGTAYVARVSFNPNGDFGIGECDIKKTDYWLWYIDLAAVQNNDLWNDANNDKKESPDELTDAESVALSFGFKHAGAFLAAEYYDRNVGKEDGSPQIESDGWYAQFGYTIVRDKWEIALRYSELDPDKDKDSNDRTEFCLGLNRYFKGLGHSLKFQTDLSWLSEEKVAPVDDLNDFRVRSQLQLVF